VQIDDELLRNSLPHRKEADPKRALRQHLIGRAEGPPQYTLLWDKGREESRFVSTVSSEGETDVLGQGVGRTKKASEKAAAVEALDAWYLSRQPKIIIPIVR